MALSDFQKTQVTPQTLNILIAATLRELDLVMEKWRDTSSFLGLIESADMDVIGVPAGTGPGSPRDVIAKFQAMIDEYVSLRDGNSVTPAVPHQQIIDLIRVR